MLMKPDPNKLASLIMSKDGEKSPVPLNEDGAIVDDTIPSDIAAEELLTAIETKDVKGIVESIRSLIELCSAVGDDEPPVS